LYQEAEDPITPVFYDIPEFSNSKNNLRKGKDYSDNGKNVLEDSGNKGSNSDESSNGSQLNG
jgi:hypothetical protein